MVRSTRSEIRKNASEAIIEGLASDGGLYIFEDFPQLDLPSLLHKSYKSLGSYILKLLLNDYTQDEVDEVIQYAYDDKFDTDNIVQYKSLKDVTILELFHGPTLAFKDMALTILPELLRVAKKKNNIQKNTIVLTATSGDTGGATLSGFQNVDGMKVIVFYPNDGVSPIQEKQMLSFVSKNAKVIALEGNFDDAQRFVKETFKLHPELSSSNSINIGRLVPQIIYYVYSYLELVRTNKIKIGDKINICVPTGNFGNILAGYIAKKMGVHINKFICASNQNNVLTDFFETGIYNCDRPFYKTNSPSMDILISSNLERLLYLISDDKTTKNWMEQLNKNKKFVLSNNEKEKLNEFYGGYCSINETIETIKNVFNSEQYLLDPHTAVAYHVYQNYRLKTKDLTPTILVSTANPYKFPLTICDALGIDYKNDVNESLNKIYQKTNVPIPNILLSYHNNKKLVLSKQEAKAQIDILIKEFNND